MMARTWLLRSVIFTAVCVSLISGAAADLVNGGFENGNFTGWTISARDVTRYSIGGSSSPPLPIEGSYFAVLTSDVSPWTELSQSIAMGVGDKLDGYAYYDVNLPAEGIQGYVRIYDSLNNPVATPWSRNNSNSPAWEAWTFTASAADTYKLVLGISESSVKTFHDQAFFDGCKYSMVPEPASLWTLALGAGAILARRRRTS